eukprot:TRINITY_DN1362_c0_g1_i1.p1 TRINITY_DN1362_c0_g1~~TRINITY_DN1362_c0_g1_i1.p1  ORF type:complete len:258 (+),score=36.66 TRINITY_DN1362_c0_g1_i1:521-1294(+)
MSSSSSSRGGNLDGSYWNTQTTGSRRRSQQPLGMAESPASVMSHASPPPPPPPPSVSSLSPEQATGEVGVAGQENGAEQNDHQTTSSLSRVEESCSLSLSGESEDERFTVNFDKQAPKSLDTLDNIKTVLELTRDWLNYKQGKTAGALLKGSIEEMLEEIASKQSTPDPTKIVIMGPLGSGKSLITSHLLLGPHYAEVGDIAPSRKGESATFTVTRYRTSTFASRSRSNSSRTRTNRIPTKAARKGGRASEKIGRTT